MMGELTLTTQEPLVFDKVQSLLSTAGLSMLTSQNETFWLRRMASARASWRPSSKELATLRMRVLSVQVPSDGRAANRSSANTAMVTTSSTRVKPRERGKRRARMISRPPLRTASSLDQPWHS
ncbi:hypothetical protein D3C71_1633270 [compost metagenome]